MISEFSGYGMNTTRSGRTSIRINLQFFADSQKTEKATPKRRQDAREKGQVLYSREISSALVLLFVFLTIKALGATFITG